MSSRVMSADCHMDVFYLPPDAFTTVHDQDRMLAQIRRERIPVVLINETRREEFATAYPEIDRYITDQYAPAGHFEIRDGSIFVSLTPSNGVAP